MYGEKMASDILTTAWAYMGVKFNDDSTYNHYRTAIYNSSIKSSRTSLFRWISLLQKAGQKSRAFADDLSS
jgi:hypothetical protein